MEISIDVSWQDLAFIWCLVAWANLAIGAFTQQLLLPFNSGLLYIYAATLLASIPGVPAYIIWKLKKRKSKEV
ncbi:MAG: hypothetical protein ABC585_05760 [Candidatus Methanosuratincola petrocarbonis]